MYTRATVKKAIDSVEEFPSEMPDWLWAKYRYADSKELLTEAFRETVRSVKQEIKWKLGIE